MVSVRALSLSTLLILTTILLDRYFFFPLVLVEKLRHRAGK